LRRWVAELPQRLPVIENQRLVGVIREADLARNLSDHELDEFVGRVTRHP